MPRTLVLALVLSAALLPLSACSGPRSSEPDASSQPSAAPAASVPVKAMTITEKQQLVADNFQPEIPVPSGTVVRGEAQGDLAWDYEIVVAAPPKDVANWYRESFVGRDWELIGETAPAPGAITLTMVKNAAQSRVSITPEGASSSRVRAVVGLGTPVLQTQ